MNHTPKDREAIVCRRCSVISRGIVGDCSHVEELIAGTVEWCARTAEHSQDRKGAGGHDKLIARMAGTAIREKSGLAARPKKPGDR